MKKIFVVAFNYKEFLEFCYQEDFNPKDVVYVNDVHDILGYSGGTIYLFGRYYLLPTRTIEEIRYYAQLHNFYTVS